MKVRLGFLLTLIFLGVFVFIILRFYYNPFESPEVIKITPRFVGTLVGSLDNNGGITSGLHPCAKNPPEVLQIMNQLISYNKCKKGNLGCNLSKPVELVSFDQLEKNFQIGYSNNFFKAYKVGVDFDFYLQRSNNPAKTETVPDTFLVCDSFFIESLNTGFSSTGAPSIQVFYPYSLDKPVFQDNQRLLIPNFLDDPSLGVAKVSATRFVDEAFMLDFMNFLYEIEYFKLNGRNTSGKIIKRDVYAQKDKYFVRDQVLKKTFNDTFPFQTTFSKSENTIQYNNNTRVITANSKKL